MIFVGESDTSISYRRPAPVFFKEEKSLSTKKERSRTTPRLVPPPIVPVKSCPVTRIFSRIPDSDRPQPVSFREDSDTSFIVQSPVYSAEKPALYFEQCYVIEEKLGSGSFGEVYRVSSKEDGQLYACKKTLFKFRGEGDRRRRMEEVQKHEKLPKHCNCVKFFRAWEERQHLYLLTEVCRSSLADVANDKHDLPEATIWEYLVDLLQGVSHLHKHNLVHMDIKPENIFFGYDGLCKLGDFGLVIDISQGPVHEAVEGDPKYLAPEVMELQFGPPADLFSLGMTILELATDLDLPRQGEAWQMLRQGTLPLAANRLSQELQTVLLGFLQPIPSIRLTADQALAMPSIRRVLRYKRVKDYCRNYIQKARQALVQSWLYLVMFFVYLARPFTHRLRGCSIQSPSSNHIQANRSAMHHSDSDFTLGYSDEDGSDDHSLAQPLSDISSSSNEGNMEKHCVNSTPIAHQFKRPADFFSVSPAIRNSFIGSPDVIDGPDLLAGDTPIPCSRSATKEQLPSFNMTSRNLMDLFNSLESDEED
ncbi:hypothetical protein Pmani_002635 [Petrolisthes manimaculis]|uniref:Membrane-associated tyrosine- and threonine-specific cdc2-inhibitory kinase n=1 Tax=Petrolisthes manimaculis TaxID=1843537 RepID=A0AAE1QHK3_9EUCA|nr:hypothetical protein Pmani_002635 [Petrolisthes manimaculis]